MDAVIDHGFVTVGEMHRLMEANPDRRFELRLDADVDGEEADTYDPNSPGFWTSVYAEDQVPTDDAQRPLRLQSYED